MPIFSTCHRTNLWRFELQINQNEGNGWQNNVYFYSTIWFHVSSATYPKTEKCTVLESYITDSMYSSLHCAISVLRSVTCLLDFLSVLFTFTSRVSLVSHRSLVVCSVLVFVLFCIVFYIVLIWIIPRLLCPNVSHVIITCDCSPYLYTSFSCNSPPDCNVCDTVLSNIHNPCLDTKFLILVFCSALSDCLIVNKLRSVTSTTLWTIQLCLVALNSTIHFVFDYEPAHLWHCLLEIEPCLSD